MPTKIEWADETLNPQAGCTRKGEPCRNCYAQIMAWRLSNMGRDLYTGTAIKNANGWNWTGEINFDPSILKKATSRARPTIWFVNSMSDLWHEKVPLSRVEFCFDEFARSPQHVYQVLTKRAERLSDEGLKVSWPDNVWQGVSVGDQKALHYVDHLRQSPAKVKFLSIEPLIEALPGLDLRGMDWVILGGESAHRPRPMEVSWVRPIIEQAVDLDIPVFFKQWGGKTAQKKPEHTVDGRFWLQFPTDHIAVERKRSELRTTYMGRDAMI